MYTPGVPHTNVYVPFDATTGAQDDGFVLEATGVPYVLPGVASSLVLTFPVNGTFTFVTPKSGLKRAVKFGVIPVGQLNDTDDGIEGITELPNVFELLTT